MAPSRPHGALPLAGETWYVPGLTNSGYLAGLVIDTGPECETYREAHVDSLAITHGHADHFSAGSRLAEAGVTVIAGRDDARLVENPEINIRGMFSWARPGDLMVTKLFVGAPCPVDSLVEEWQDERARPVHLPGHTLGHFGFLTPDRVLFCGDALYQSQIWDRHPLPYSIDPEMVTSSLRAMTSLEFDWLVPGHGEPCGRDAALAHIEHHLQRIAAIEEFICRTLGSERTTEEVIGLVSAHLGLGDNPAQYWLAVTTVKGYLGNLLGREKLEFFVRDHMGWWRTT